MALRIGRSQRAYYFRKFENSFDTILERMINNIQINNTFYSLSLIPSVDVLNWFLKRAASNAKKGAVKQFPVIICWIFMLHDYFDSFEV